MCTRSKGHCPKKYLDNDPRFTHDLIGYNFKTMEFQAGLGVVQLSKFDDIIKKRQDNVKYLNDKLINYQNSYILPQFSRDYSYLAYPIIIRDNKINRKELRKKLDARGIESRPLFGSIPTKQPAYNQYKSTYDGLLPNADYLSERAFYVGCHQYLSKDNLDYMGMVLGDIVDEILNEKGVY